MFLTSKNSIYSYSHDRRKIKQVHDILTNVTLARRCNFQADKNGKRLPGGIESIILPQPHN
jgi:hypothetical protein